jgi:hypothetical protein
VGGGGEVGRSRVYSALSAGQLRPFRGWRGGGWPLSGQRGPLRGRSRGGWPLSGQRGPLRRRRGGGWPLSGQRGPLRGRSRGGWPLSGQRGALRGRRGGGWPLSGLLGALRGSTPALPRVERGRLAALGSTRASPRAEWGRLAEFQSGGSAPSPGSRHRECAGSAIIGDRDQRVAASSWALTTGAEGATGSPTAARRPRRSRCGPARSRALRPVGRGGRRRPGLHLWPPRRPAPRRGPRGWRPPRSTNARP